mmetsp:Transcript_22900/g.53437  ORF Transcript_22900/g.53437 Transcript_22900/m.53437 type:complete len:342 (+) Transcript_22900:28-1053(+)
MFLFTTGINKYYDTHESLGSGAFAVVKRGVHKKTGENVAIKIIDKKAIGADMAESLQTEIEILQKVSHPNIIGLKEIFDSSKKLHLVMEMVSGGELFDRIVEKGHYSETDAADLMRAILDGLRYLHGLGIIHRDLKPENLLYATPAEDSPIKIADFGLAKICPQQEIMFTTCGTPGYVAPEILRGEGYGAEVDTWSCGVILYILLCGFPPFFEESTPALFDLIMKCDYSFPDPYWTNVSDSAKDVISRILVPQPGSRLTIDEILDHPFFSGEVSKEHMPSVGVKLKEWCAKRKLKAAMQSVLASKRMQVMSAAVASKKSAAAAAAAEEAPAAAEAEPAAAE